MKTAKIIIDSHKDPDGWHELLRELGYLNCDEDGNDLTTEAQREVVKKHFDFCEYASLELEIDETFRVVSGRILPK